MTDSVELILKYERSTRWFRVLHLLLMFIALVVLSFLTVLATDTNEHLKAQVELYQKQNRQESADTQRIISEIKRQNDTQTAYIQCIAQFFAQRDRTNLTLTDLNGCQINATTTSVKPTFSGEPAPTSPFRTQVTPTPTPGPSPTPTPASTGVVQRVLKGMGL